MKNPFKKKSLTINYHQLLPGDILMEYDNVHHAKIRYAQKLTGNIQYSNFVHGGIIDLDRKSIIHSTGADGLQKTHMGTYLDDHENYRIYRLKGNYLNLATKMATIAHMMQENTHIPYSLAGNSKQSAFNMLTKTLLFKNKKAPKTGEELRAELNEFLDENSDFTTYCTKFVTFVLQYACAELNLDSTKILGKIRDTKATPARLVEALKHSSSFTEFKSDDEDDDEYDEDEFIQPAIQPHRKPPLPPWKTAMVHPAQSNSLPRQAWNTPPSRPAPSPPSMAPQRAAPSPPKMVPQRVAPPPPPATPASPLKRQGARRWKTRPI